MEAPFKIGITMSLRVQFLSLTWKQTLILTVIAACGLPAQSTNPTSGGVQLNSTNAITCPSGKSYQTKVNNLIKYLTTLIYLRRIVTPHPLLLVSIDKPGANSQIATSRATPVIQSPKQIKYHPEVFMR